MAEAGPARERLVAELRSSLEADPGSDPTDAGRLACLLIGRRRFAALVGEPPGGPLASLPSPFKGFSLPAELEGLVADCADASAPRGRIGEGYEAAIDPGARGERGQFFTPEPVADALVRWALAGTADRRPRVLDPAVGTGTFLLAALCRWRGRGSSMPLDRLVGVDVDAVALHLAGLRLAATADAASPDGLSLHHASFFDCVPADGPTARSGTLELAPVDAVVGNPPFVRAEALKPGIDHYRGRLAAFGPDGETPLLDGPDALSRRSDAYVYFVTHATRFLRPGGRLALVLPTKWLTSEYGEGLRAFLRDQHLVHAVVGFGARAFGDALVDTALLLAERADRPAAGAPLRFHTVDGPDALEDLGGETGSSTTERTQRALIEAGSLRRPLEVPADLVSLLDDSPFVRLDAMGEVARGTMTGANRFFFVDGDTERFDIEPRFLRPAVKSLRSIERPTLVDPDRWLVDVHGYVEGILAELDDTADPESAVKAALDADGFDGMRSYIDHAESAGWHDGRTCRSRPVWFDLGPLRAPAAFVPKLLRERVFCVRNAAGAVPSNAIDGLWPHDDVDAAALLAVLNASVGSAAMEVTGRDEAGLLQLMTYETSSLPTLDVRACSPADRQALAAAGEAFANRPGPDTRAALDAAVDDAFDLALAPATIREHVSRLRTRRVDGAEPARAAGD